MYIAEASESLGISVEAMRAKVHRKMNLKQEEDIPPPFMIGSKWVWLRTDWQSWLEQKAKGSKQ